VTLLEFWRLIASGRWIVLTSTLVIAAIIGAHALFIARPLYSATVLMSPLNLNDDADAGSRIGSQLAGLVSFTGLTSSVGAGKDEAIALLNSRGFTQQFITDNNLLPELFASRWDKARGRWLVDSAEDIPTAEDGYVKFDNFVRKVMEDDKTGLVTLEIRWGDRIRAAEWANALVKALNKKIRENTVQEADKSIAYLNRQLLSTSELSVRQSIFGLLEKNIRKVMLASVRDDFAFRIIDPAIPSDPDKFVSPHRVLRIFVGAVVGFMLGVAVVLFRALLAAPPLARTN
jgi:uncharacterized protein involved in exopolysaccharide biosynthesis